MKIGILGTGTVGQVLGAKLVERGQEVTLGTRTPDDLDQRRGSADTLRAWLERVGEHGRVASFDETAASADLVINATNGKGTLQALQLAGADNLSGKILIDISNPLDFSGGFPPSFSVCNTDSLGEQIQRAHPSARVVKTLNTVTATLMADPGKLAGGEHHLFISGNDSDAKATVVVHLNQWFGWKHIIDLGDISTARGTEMYLALWTRLYAALGTAELNVRVEL